MSSLTFRIDSTVTGYAEVVPMRFGTPPHEEYITIWCGYSGQNEHRLYRKVQIKVNRHTQHIARRVREVQQQGGEGTKVYMRVSGQITSAQRWNKDSVRVCFFNMSYVAQFSLKSVPSSKVQPTIEPTETMESITQGEQSMNDVPY